MNKSLACLKVTGASHYEDLYGWQTVVSIKFDTPYTVAFHRNNSDDDEELKSDVVDYTITLRVGTKDHESSLDSIVTVPANITEDEVCFGIWSIFDEIKDRLDAVYAGIDVLDSHINCICIDIDELAELFRPIRDF